MYLFQVRILYNVLLNVNQVSHHGDLNVYLYYFIVRVKICYLNSLCRNVVFIIKCNRQNSPYCKINAME